MPESQSNMGFPVTITPEAVVQMKRLIERRGTPASMIRIGVKGGGCSGLEYVFALETDSKPHDVCAEFDGVRVVCDAKSAVYLAGATLEYSGNLVGGGFQFKNPNAKRSCGCGTSFTPADQA